MRIQSPISRLKVITAVCCASVLAAACAQSTPPPLPDLKRTEGDGMMSPAQQKKAIEDLAAKKTAVPVDADAAKKTEPAR